MEEEKLSRRENNDRGNYRIASQAKNNHVSVEHVFGNRISTAATWIM